MGWGGWFNPVNWVQQAANAVASAFQSASNALAQIDPGPAIGNIGAQLDKGVRDVIPGGWAMVGAIALTIISAGTIDLEPEVLAAAESADYAAGWSATGSAASTAGTTVAGTAAVPTAVQSALTAAGTGALYGGGIGGTMAAIKGQDPIKGAMMGALYGGLTGGLTSGFSSALNAADLTSAGLNPYLAKAMSSISLGVAKGQDISTLLENTALNTGLGALGGEANKYMDPVFTNAMTGGLGSAIKGGDPLLGAATGAGGTVLGGAIDSAKDYAKDAWNSLTAPTASLGGINPATGQPWSETGSGLAGGAASISLGANLDQPVTADLAYKYLKDASSDLSTKVTDLLPTIEQQKAELLAQANDIKENYAAYTDKQKAIDDYLTSDQFKTAHDKYIADKATLEDAMQSSGFNDKYSKISTLQNEANTMYNKILNKSNKILKK